jgi:hypothetical protein
VFFYIESFQMNLRIVFGVLLIGLLIQCVGCGGPQQALWDEYDKAVGGGATNASECVRILELIKKENPDSKHPKSGDGVDDTIQTWKNIAGSQQALKEMERSERNFDERMKDLDR